MAAEEAKYLEKCEQINQAYQALRNAFYKSPVVATEDKTAIHNFIKTLYSIRNVLNKASFTGPYPAINQLRLNTYDWLADCVLLMLTQQPDELVQKLSLRPVDNTLTTFKKLDLAVRALGAVSALTAGATFLLAASPTIIVSTLPTVLGFLLQAITPLLVLLPPLLIATAVITTAFIGVKIAKAVYEKQTVQDKSVRDSLRRFGDKSTARIGELDKELANMTEQDQHTFFKQLPNSTETASVVPTTSATASGRAF